MNAKPEGCRTEVAKSNQNEAETQIDRGTLVFSSVKDARDTLYPAILSGRHKVRPLLSFRLRTKLV